MRRPRRQVSTACGFCIYCLYTVYRSTAPRAFAISSRVLRLVEVSLAASAWVGYMAAVAQPSPTVFVLHLVPQSLWVAMLSTAYYTVAHTMALWWEVFTHMDSFIESTRRSLVVLQAGQVVQRLVEDLRRTFSYETVMVVESGHEQHPAGLMCVSASNPDLVNSPITQNESYRRAHPDRVGVFAHVAATKRYYCTNDPEEADEQYLEANELPGVRAQLVQPVLVNDQVISFLVVQSSRRRAFTLRDKHILGIAATLIGQLKAAEESDRYHHALDVLVREQLEVGNALAVARRIADVAVGPYQAVKALVYVYLGGTKFDGPYAAAAQDSWRPAPRQAAVGDASPLGLALNAAETALYARSLAGPDELDADGLWPYLDASGPAVSPQSPATRARVILRLEHEGRCVGLVYFYFRPPRTFLETDRARFEEFARLAANAIAAPPAARGGGNPLRLTPREREIAALVAEGLTNPQIAQELTRRGKGPIQSTTVSGHVSNILEKLGERRRAAIGRHVGSD